MQRENRCGQHMSNDKNLFRNENKNRYMPYLQLLSDSEVYFDRLRYSYQGERIIGG